MQVFYNSTNSGKVIASSEHISAKFRKWLLECIAYTIVFQTVGGGYLGCDSWGKGLQVSRLGRAYREVWGKREYMQPHP